jgi:DUF4097 and DUF4098 domain-containing protein YvlB
VSGSIDARDITLTEDSSFTTVSGNVDVRLNSAVEDLRFDLSSVSGRIVVGNIRTNKGLRMGSYGALVRGKTVSGALIFK